jgi:predicted AAA+ superfamily ATPase
MNYIKRDIEKIILEASHSYSAVLVTGLRQVGKTTTFRHLMDEN